MNIPINISENLLFASEYLQFSIDEKRINGITEEYKDFVKKSFLFQTKAVHLIKKECIWFLDEELLKAVEYGIKAWQVVDEKKNILMELHQLFLLTKKCRDIKVIHKLACHQQFLNYHK